MVLVEEDVPLLVFFWLLDPLKYNPPISDRGLRGGSIYSTRSSIYKLEVEQPNIKGLKDGPIAGYTSVLAFVYCQ